MFDISHYHVEVTRHALNQALTRGVTSDMVEATVRGGRIKRFGKNNMKFFRNYKNFTVVCVDEIRKDRIFIVTVAVKSREK
jgi:hypothetical protein